MSINDLPALSALRTRMQWHQERQRVLAENVSNSNTPNFRPRDLVELKFDEKGANAAAPAGSLAMLRTSQVHLSASGAEPIARESPYQPSRDADQRQDRHKRQEECKCLHAPSPANRVFFGPLSAERGSKATRRTANEVSTSSVVI